MAEVTSSLSNLSTQERLPFTVPQYLVRLTHEPVIGLHFVAAHAQKRAVPGVVAVRNAMNAQASNLREVALDAKYTSESLQNDLEASLRSMQRTARLVREALENTARASDPHPGPVIIDA